MRRIIVALFVAFLTLACINWYRRSTEGLDFKIKFHVYRQQAGTPLEIILRTIKPSYDSLISAERTNLPTKDKNIGLYKVNNNIFGGSPDIHYLIVNRETGAIDDLKSRFLFREIEDYETIDFDTIDSYSVDVSAFRKVFETSVMTLDEISARYAVLLSNSEDSVDFKKIIQTEDIDQLLQSHVRISMFDEGGNITDFGFLSQRKEHEFYYWFYDKGIVKIQVDYENGFLKSIETQRMGYLGIEVVHL